MSKFHRRARRRRSEGKTFQLLEESFHLVRSAGLPCFWIYYLGAVPWSVGLLYFVADMSRSSLAARDAAFASLAVAGLWLWLRYCEARYCALLRNRLDPGGAVRLGLHDTLRALSALWFAQAFRGPILVFGLVFAVPFAWAFATRQNFAALALVEPPGEKPLRRLVGRSVRLSHDQWAQNHGIVAVLGFVALFTWVNLVATCIFVPTLVKSFFGVESLFTLSPEAAVFNTTFLFGSALLVRLVLGPLVCAVYTLRCFHADSRSSGADLLSRLESCREGREREERRERGIAGRTAAVVLAALAAVAALPAGAAPSDPSAETAGSTVATTATRAKASPPDTKSEPGSPAPETDEGIEQFRDEISSILEQKKYQWRLSRRQLGEEPPEQSWLGQRLSEIGESAKRAIRAAEKWLKEQLERFFGRDPSQSRSGGEKEGSFFKGLGSTLSLGLVALVLGLLVWLVAVLFRRHRAGGKEVLEDGGLSGPVDLESEDLVATQLHEDEWMRLAREQIARGEGRLAIRALFLATLAHLGERGLLRIARSKSNRDYRRELLRRAGHLPRMREAFDENTELFERVWYGLHELGEGTVDAFLANHGLIASESSAAIPARASASAP